jgi:lipoate-protein ligase A
MIWRLIDTDLADPYYVTAADEAILEAYKRNLVPPTLHFYRRKPPGVSIGRSKKIDEDVSVEKCKKYGVKIVRRISGGGTIFTDEGCLIYSMVDSLTEKTYKPEKIFQEVCSSIINALSTFDIKASFKPPNDVLVNNKKISGSAQVRKNKFILIHGTMLVYTNLNIMRDVLKNPKIENVSTLEIEQKSNIPSISQIKQALIKEFEKTFDIKLKKDNFTRYEKDLIKILIEEKYSKDEWNFKR